MTIEERPSTCGRGIAAGAELPAALGRVVAALGNVLDSHVPGIAGDDEAARQERAAYVELGAQHRRAAEALAQLARRMEQCRDLPMPAHDMEALAAPSALAAFEASVKLERELMTLLQQRVESHQKMLVEWVAEASEGASPA